MADLAYDKVNLQSVRVFIDPPLIVRGTNRVFSAVISHLDFGSTDYPTTEVGVLQHIICRIKNHIKILLFNKNKYYLLLTARNSIIFC